MPKGMKPEDFYVTRNNIHIACEDLDFVWDEKQLSEFRQMWREGKSIKQMADVFGRDPDEVLILAVDQCRDGRLKKREGGVLGIMGKELKRNAM